VTVGETLIHEVATLRPVGRRARSDRGAVLAAQDLPRRRRVRRAVARQHFSMRPGRRACSSRSLRARDHVLEIVRARRAHRADGRAVAALTAVEIDRDLVPAPRPPAAHARVSRATSSTCRRGALRRRLAEPWRSSATCPTTCRLRSCSTARTCRPGGRLRDATLMLRGRSPSAWPRRPDSSTGPVDHGAARRGRRAAADAAAGAFRPAPEVWSSVIGCASGRRRSRSQTGAVSSRWSGPSSPAAQDARERASTAAPRECAAASAPAAAIDPSRPRTLHLEELQGCGHLDAGIGLLWYSSREYRGITLSPGSPSSYRRRSAVQRRCRSGV